MCACLFVCLFFWRAGTDDHKEDGIGNHVNFKSLSSSSAENVTQERKSRSKNGPFEDSKKLATSTSACEDLESERFGTFENRDILCLNFFLICFFFVFLPPEVTSDRFIYGGLLLRFHSVLLLSPASSIFGAFSRGWSCTILIFDSSPKCSESH